MARKRGMGSIIPLEKDKPKSKCRKWKVVVPLGKDPVTKKYRQKARVYRGTYSGALQARDELWADVRGGRVVRKSAWTFDDYADHFIEVRKASGEVTDATVYGNRRHLSMVSHIIGSTRLQDVTPAVLNAVYAELRSGNSLSGRKLTGSSVNTVHKSLSAMFKLAVKEGVIVSNPCANAETPKRDTQERKPLSPEDVHMLLALLDPAKSMECGIVLAATLGLRRGEVCGLSWGDVDFTAGTVNVRRSFDSFGNLKAPKTVAGARILPMSPFTASALRDRRAAQLEAYGAYGEKPNKYVAVTDEGPVLKPEVPVVTDVYEQRCNPNVLGHWWSKHREGFGVGGTTLHELRHSFLTVAAQQGVHPSVMQKLAGHKDPSITLGIYTHVNMEQQRQAMESMQKVFA